MSHVINVLIHLINEINRKEISENKHSDKVNDIAEEVHRVSKQQKGKERLSGFKDCQKQLHWYKQVIHLKSY